MSKTDFCRGYEMQVAQFAELEWFIVDWLMKNDTVGLDMRKRYMRTRLLPVLEA